VKTTLAEALFLCRNECRNGTPVFTVNMILSKEKKIYDSCLILVR
jgi:hypothetical protein